MKKFVAERTSHSGSPAHGRRSHSVVSTDHLRHRPEESQPAAPTMRLPHQPPGPQLQRYTTQPEPLSYTARASSAVRLRSPATAPVPHYPRSQDGSVFGTDFGDYEDTTTMSEAHAHSSHVYGIRSPPKRLSHGEEEGSDHDEPEMEDHTFGHGQRFPALAREFEQFQSRISKEDYHSYPTSTSGQEEKEGVIETLKPSGTRDPPLSQQLRTHLETEAESAKSNGPRYPPLSHPLPSRQQMNFEFLKPKQTDDPPLPQTLPDTYRQAARLGTTHTRSESDVTTRQIPLRSTHLPVTLRESSRTIGDPEQPEFDYDEEDLASKVAFDMLRRQPFDENPRAKPDPLPEDKRNAPLPERVEHAYNSLPDEDQVEFFSQLQIDEWEETGELIIEKMVGLMSRMKELRKAKRDMAMQFEEEISKRNDRVARKRQCIEDNLDRLKTGGAQLLTPKKQ